MVLVIVLVAGTFLALRWARERGMTARGVPMLRVLGRTGLTKSSIVAVVEVGERRFLVGAGEDGVRLLSELDAAAAAEAVVADGVDDGADDDLDLLPAGTTLDDELTALLSGTTPDRGADGSTPYTTGPRIGPLDRLRALTVRTPTGEPIRDQLRPR